MKAVHLLAGLAILLLVSPASSQAPAAPASGAQAKAIFAGGCFWCMEPPFDALKGVISTTSGYIGGQKRKPTYEEVSAGGTGHAEAVEVVYDPTQVSYQKLLEVFWRNIDPTTGDRQFCDVGNQYRPEIFVQDEAQKQAAEKSKAEVEKKFGTIAVKITPAGPF
ncbi:MAG TPA: peptide-methionine (S)-S-oxide reductase MsrA, partial [Burkholderiales bacterium]|nr:peptide-methionine (S)-S-oxide reductase MsrA [Burkholderiales bacterium]